jgi:hypothetical protein
MDPYVKIITYTAICFIPWPTPRQLVKNATLQQKRWYQFSLWVLTFVCSNIPSAAVYGVYINSCQLMRYSRACDLINENRLQSMNGNNRHSCTLIEINPIPAEHLKSTLLFADFARSFIYYYYYFQYYDQNCNSGHNI